VRRERKIADSEDFKAFESFIRCKWKISPNDQFHWVSISRLNA